MARRNPLEKVNDRIADRFKKSLKAAETSKAVPFGEEEVTPREFRSRFASMSEIERKQVLDKNGQVEILRQLKDK